MINDFIESLEQQAAALAHEIKNPLATLRVYVQLLEAEDPVIEHKKCYSMIYKQINKVTDMTLELIGLAKLTAYVFDDVNINELLIEAVSEFEPLTRGAAVIELHNEPNDIYVSGDYKKLLQVFINIIKNAVEACVDDKPDIYISVATEGDYAAITVKDNGCGISADSIGNVYDMFYTTKQNGSGIGLALTKTIINGHNGALDISSDDGEGTRVRILLPLNS